MDRLLLNVFLPCDNWPCYLGVVADVIIILAAIKFVVQYLKSSKASGSNK